VAANTTAHAELRYHQRDDARRWEDRGGIAKGQRKTLSNLVGGIDTDPETPIFWSGMRLFVLGHYPARLLITYDRRPPNIATYNGV
jgi:hypothetical protein